MTETKKGLRIIYPTGEETTYIIFRKHKFTPGGHCVSHDGYYEIAGYSSYTRIDKKTLEVTSNFIDVDVYEKEENVKVEIVKL